ncbi:MAG: zf-TFIIB domain-containing protein [Polyangia bacterium]
MLNKPSDAEEEYFAREEAAKRQREALEVAKRLEGQERERLKVLHFMKCPKCGMDLQEQQFKGVTIDKCFTCGGMFFDQGEFEALVGHDQPNVFNAIASIFRVKKP